jgi:hypothetical protein
LHEKTLAAFKKAGYDVSNNLENQFIAGTDPNNRANHASYHYTLGIMRDSGAGITDSVITAKRVIDPKTKNEFVLVHYNITGRHYDGRDLSVSWSGKGRYTLPVFGKAFSPEKMRWEPTDQVIASTEVFEYPYAAEKTMIENMDGKLVPLSKLITQDTRFYVMSDKGQKLTVSKADWMKLTREELLKKYDASNSVQAEALSELTKAITRAQELTK